MFELPPPAEPRSIAFQPLGRRIQTLLYTAPIHELESNKLRHAEWWEPYDLRSLQLDALWVVIERQGLDSGAPRTVVRTLVAQRAAEMAPEQQREQHIEVADCVIGWLLNEQSSEAGFHYEYLDRDAEGLVRRFGHDVVLLHERQHPDGSLVLLASAGAINLFIGSLDVDVADAHRADERLLEDYIAAGRFDAAQQQAQRADLRSKQYAETVRQWLYVARQDIRMLDWSGEVLTAMEQARDHIAERLRDEAQMRFRIDEYRADIEDPVKLSSVVRLADMIDDCQRRHTELHSLLMSAAEVFLAEQQRQRLAPSPALTVLAPIRELLRPALELAPPDSMAFVDTVFVALAGPRPPELMDLFHLLDDLLAPRREEADDDLYIEDLAFDDADEAPRFQPEAVDIAQEVLRCVQDRPARMGVLLADARRRASNLAAETGELIRLGALWAFAPDGDATDALLPDGTVAVDDGMSLDDPEFAGADLLLGTSEALDGD